MGRKITAICVLTALLLLPLAGCGRDKQGENRVTGVPSDVPQQTKEPSLFPIEVTEITYYTLSEELETVEVTSVLTGSVDMTPRELAEYVAGTMGDVSGIIFRVGGEAYRSENRNFEMDYVYMGR